VFKKSILIASMEADVLSALQAKPVYLAGGRDRDDRLSIIVPVPHELQPWTKPYLEQSMKYILAALRCINK